MPAKNRKFSHVLRTGAVALLILLLFTVLFSNIIISSYLKRELKKQSTENFNIEVNDLSVNIFTGKITAEKVSMMISDKHSDIKLDIGNIYVNDFSVIKYLKEKSYHSGELIIENGNIYYFDKKDSSIENNSKALPEILIDRVVANNISLKYEDKDSKAITLKDVEFLLREFNMKEMKQPSLLLEKKLSYLNLKEMHYFLKDSTYTFLAQQISFLPSKNLLVIDSIVVDPGKNEAAFFKRKKLQTDRFDMNIEKIVCNYEQIYSETGTLYPLVNYIFISKPIVNVSRDRNFYREPTEKPTVQNLIKNNKFPLIIKKIFTADGRIEYREIQVDDPKPIDVWFSNFSSEWKNLNTTDTSGNFEILAKAKLYDEGPTNLQLNFPLKNESQYFIAVAQLKNIRLKRFNNAFAGKVNLKIKEGDIQSMQCRFIGGVDSSKGEMKLEYTNLKVETKDKTTKKSNSIKEKVKTFIANNILLNKGNNPETYSYVPLEAKRDKTRFIFNYIIKTLASGAVETVKKSKDQGVQKK